MFKNLEVLQTAMDMARHAGAREAVSAANLANADTPGYRARTLAPFADIYEARGGQALRQTRAGHIGDTLSTSSNARVTIADTEAAPNGNSVSLEQEMLNAVEIQREHERALAIYKHSLDLLRLSIGRR